MGYAFGPKPDISPDYSGKNGKTVTDFRTAKAMHLNFCE